MQKTLRAIALTASNLPRLRTPSVHEPWTPDQRQKRERCRNVLKDIFCNLSQISALNPEDEPRVDCEAGTVISPGGKTLGRIGKYLLRHDYLTSAEAVYSEEQGRALRTTSPESIATREEILYAAEWIGQAIQLSLGLAMPEGFRMEVLRGDAVLRFMEAIPHIDDARQADGGISSCMNGHKARYYEAIALNPGVAALAVLRGPALSGASESTAYGRALLWTPEGPHGAAYLDRIYARRLPLEVDVNVGAVMRGWMRSEGIVGIYENDEAPVVEVELRHNGTLPYMDTLAYGRAVSGTNESYDGQAHAGVVRLSSHKDSFNLVARQTTGDFTFYPARPVSGGWCSYLLGRATCSQPLPAYSEEEEMRRVVQIVRQAVRPHRHMLPSNRLRRLVRSVARDIIACKGGETSLHVRRLSEVLRRAKALPPGDWRGPVADCMLPAEEREREPTSSDLSEVGGLLRPGECVMAVRERRYTDTDPVFAGYWHVHELIYRLSSGQTLTRSARRRYAINHPSAYLVSRDYTEGFAPDGWRPGDDLPF